MAQNIEQRSPRDPFPKDEGFITMAEDTDSNPSDYKGRVTIKFLVDGESSQNPHGHQHLVVFGKTEASLISSPLTLRTIRHVRNLRTLPIGIPSTTFGPRRVIKLSSSLSCDQKGFNSLSSNDLSPDDVYSPLSPFIFFRRLFPHASHQNPSRQALCQDSFPHLRRRPGKVIRVSSTSFTISAFSFGDHLRHICRRESLRPP